ncbi:sensor histidine kinase [Paenibacillus sp. GXUN7292]|uniref:sensor histidine kinase n=1 Tax=Paenibacillus sp. GXUN7292 TaxID=3422499 RepID=UPI003D7EF890
MRTLYVRIVVIFIIITIFSTVVSLFIANAYYANKMRHYNEEEIMHIGLEIRELYELSPHLELGQYLNKIAAMGFQIYAVDEQLQTAMYGSPFRHTQFEEEQIRHVLEGGSYKGMLEQKQLLPIMGYFENSLRNTIGLPIKAEGKQYALFIRANLEQQIGEVRILLGLLMGFAFLLSLILIVILTRYIVKPLQVLKAATHKIVDGDYNLQLDIRRKDEFGDLAKHFSHMAESIKRLDDMRQEFVANVSHEFQTPITSIQGFSETMMNNEMSEDEKQRYLQIIQDESKRLSSLSKQLLMLAALDKNMQLTKRTAFRLDEQIRQIFITLERQWTGKQLEIELELPEIVIQADEQLLYQVWFNLISNSIKFCSPQDTIAVRIDVGKEVTVEIQDTGIGIAPDELPYIFDRFYKSDKARERAKTGSGLGLSICRKIIDLHHGSIHVTSELNKGTSFRIKLPHW